MVNIAAVFGGIHFYTQWFSILGANAISVLLAGVILIAIALGAARVQPQGGRLTSRA